MTRSAGIIGAVGLTLAAVLAPGGASACDGQVETVCDLATGRYHLRLPDAGEGPFPVLVMLHDAGGSGAARAGSAVAEAGALARGYAVIAPDGLVQRLADDSLVSGWRLAGTETGGRDDIAFLDHLLDDASARAALDRDRVVVTGHGHGAALAWEIACLAPEIARAYAPRSGGFFATAPAKCAGTRPILHLHAPGADWRLKADGASTAEPGTPAPRVAIETTLTLAAAGAGCAASTPVDPSALPEGWQGLAWSGCTDGAGPALVVHDEPGVTTRAQIDLVLDWFEAGLTDADAPLAALASGDRTD